MISQSQITPELANLTIQKLNQAPYFTEQLNFQESNNTRRKTYSFGYNYFSMANNNFQFTHIPSSLKILCLQWTPCLDH